MGDFPNHARQIGLLRNDDVDLRQGAGESNRWLRLKLLRNGERDENDDVNDNENLTPRCGS